MPKLVTAAAVYAAPMLLCRGVAPLLRASEHAVSVGALRSRDLFLQNVPMLFPDRRHPGTAIARTNKREVRKRLRILARALGARDPRQLSDQLALLIDGAYSQAITLGAASLRREISAMAKLFIDAQVNSRKS